MNKMDDRKNAFEKQMVMDEETRFKIEARTSKLFGLWAASKMNMEGEAAQSYAIEVVGANLEEAGFEDILRKVKKDFGDRNAQVSDTEMRAELNRLHTEARHQIIPDDAN